MASEAGPARKHWVRKPGTELSPEALAALRASVPCPGCGAVRTGPAPTPEEPTPPSMIKHRPKCPAAEEIRGRS